MAQLVPYPKFRAVDDDGLPLVGGFVYTYAPGTSTPKEAYTDYTLSTPHTNPIVLDALGEASIFIDGSTDFVLADAAGAQRWGPIRALDPSANSTLTDATLGGALTVTSTAVTWSGNPTHSGNHAFANNVAINGNATLGDSAADTVTVNANTISYPNNVTHANNHVYSGDVSVSGNTTLGNASTDTATINAATTFPLAVTTHTFGATFGNTARSGVTTLDWYEEGDWTPTLVPASGSGITYSTRLGTFTRIGNRCLFEMWLALSSLGTASGSCYISGLPFTVKTEVPSGIDGYPVFVGQASAFTGLTGALGGQCLASSTRVYLHQSAAAGASVVGISVFTATSSIYISGQYPI